VLRLGVVASVPLAMFYAARPTMDTLLEAKVMSRLLLSCLLLEILITGLGAVFLTPPYAALLGLGVASLAAGVYALIIGGYAVHQPRR
jgi:hypothetical protein